MTSLAVDDLTLYYEAHGRTDAPPLVLLHGFNSTGAFWQAQLASLGARYRLLVPDWRGHGRTNNPAGLAAMNHRQFARDIAAFCRALGIGQAIFCGESSGAMMLLSLALAEPGLMQALVLAGGTHFYSPELRAWWRQQTPETVTPPVRIPAMRAQHTAMGPDQWRLTVDAWIALGQHAHDEDFPQAEELRAIQAPTLIVHGDRDRFFAAEVPVALYRLLPNAELCVLPATGHTPPRERPDWFNAIVLDFLARRAQER